MTQMKTKDLPLGNRQMPKVLFVDDLNTYRDILPGVSTYELKNTIACTYIKCWALTSTVNMRPIGKLNNITLDPELLPYPDVKYKEHVVKSVDVNVTGRQLVITFQLGLR